MNELTTLTQQVLGIFFLLSLVLGAISQRTHFCTMGAVSDVVNMEDWTRARQWMLAVGVAMVVATMFGWAMEPSTAADDDFDPPAPGDGGGHTKELAPLG